MHHLPNPIYDDFSDMMTRGWIGEPFTIQSKFAIVKPTNDDYQWCVDNKLECHVNSPVTEEVRNGNYSATVVTSPATLSVELHTPEEETWAKLYFGERMRLITRRKIPSAK